MFRAVCRSSSGAPTVFAASGLHTHAVTARSQVWVGTGVGTVPVVIVNVLWNNKFRYQVASCWLLLLSHTTMHGSMNIKPTNFVKQVNLFNKTKGISSVKRLSYSFIINNAMDCPKLRYCKLLRFFVLKSFIRTRNVHVCVGGPTMYDTYTPAFKIVS